MKLLAELKRVQRLDLPAHHQLRELNPDRMASIFLRTYEQQPPDFTGLLATRGVGPKTVRALSLLAELLYGAPASTRDPVRFSFAHGGKDGHPYPVDRHIYDRSIDTLEQAVKKARLGNREKLDALRRLGAWAAGET